MEQTLENVGGLDEETDANVALDTIQQTCSLLNSYLDETKIDQCVQAILPACGTRGILRYIDCHLVTKKGKDEHEKSKIEAIKILQKLLSDSRFHVFVAQVCYNIYKSIRKLTPREFESSSCQHESMHAIILLLENFADSVIKKEEEEDEDEKFELEKLYEELLIAQEKSKYSATVRGRILECLGVLAALGRESFLGAGKNAARFQLMRVFTGSLKDQVESSNKKVEASIILGCVKGMDKFLEAFKKDQLLEEQHESLKQFYGNLEQIIDPRCSIANDSETVKVKRREFQRVGLDFVANHADFLAGNLLENHRLWFDDLLVWCKSPNQEDSRSGIRAIMKFLEETKAHAEHLVATRTHLDKVNAYVEFLAGRVNEIMDKTESTKTELRIGVKSAGLLASVCENQVLMEALFTKIMQHIEAIIIELNMDTTDKYKSSSSLIHTYVESAGNMLLSMKISDTEARETFESRLHIVENLCILLVTYYPELRENFRYFAPGSFLKVVSGLYGNHRSYCEPFLDRVIHEGLTHIIASPTEAEAEILVEAYNSTETNNSRDSSTESVYNRLGIRTVKFYTRFWTGLTGSPEAETNPVAEIIYSKVLDWIMRTIGKLDLSLTFVDNEENPDISLADPMLDTKASEAKDFQLFINMVDFVTIVVRYSHHQYFSGWIEVFVETSLEYIELHPLVSGFYRLVALAFEIGSELKFFEDESSRIFRLSSTFLQSLARRIQEFRDDLLLAVLEVWLAAPDKIILHNGQFLSSTLETVFNAGKNSLTLGRRGLYAMQRWFQIPEFPSNLMEQLMNQLFPIWLTYFSASGCEEEEVRLEVKETKKKQGVRYRRLQTVLGLELKETSAKELQLDILKLIGSYGHFIQAPLDETCSGFSTQTKSLQYAVPFQDIKPAIFLDDFLPRLIKLCFDSSDRQIRSSACEVFHSYVLYYLGSYASKGNNPSSEIWRGIFLALVQLGSDSDIVVKQLFNPLTIQTVHWCSSKHHTLGQITLEMIMDGLVQVEDPGRRDFSCVCLQEYFEWCWKQENNEHMVKVVKYLISLSQHAAAQYRQGAVLGFNGIYTKFREDENLQDLYTFQLLHGFVVSLSLSSEFEETSLLVRSTKRALGHLQRIIKKDKFVIFNVRTSRRVPVELKGNTLRHIVDWLLLKSAETWRVCRKECFRLINEFIPHIQGIANSEVYLNTIETDWTPEGLMLVAEKSLQKSKPSDTFSHFLTSLEIASDFYAFLKTQCSYPSEKLLQSNCKSKFLSALSKLLNRGLNRLQNRPQEAKEHSDKLIAIVVNMSKLDNLLPPDLEAKVIESSAILWKVQSQVTFKAQPDLVETWSKYWTHCKGAEGILAEFGPKLKEIFKLDFSVDFPGINYLKWLGSVAHSGFLKAIFDESDLVLGFKSAWYSIEKLTTVRRKEDRALEEKTLSNRDRSAVQLLFNIVVGLGVESDVIESKIFDPTLIKRPNERVARGELYQDLFASSLPLCPRLLEFSRLVQTHSLESVGKLIQRLILSVKNDSRLARKCGSLIVENCIQIWSQLALNCTFPVISALMSGMAALDMDKCKNARTLADWWCGSRMMMDPNLSVKEKSNFVHFLGLFAQTADSELLRDVLSTTHEMLLNTLSSDCNWTIEENYIVKILQAVLKVFELIPGNLDVIKIIVLVVAKVSVICASDENSCSVRARKRLVQIVPTKLEYNDDDQYQVLKTVYDVVMGQESDLYRRTVAVSKYCLVPLVSCVSERAAKLFYFEYINDLETSAGIDPSNIPQACRKITATNLLEVLCIRKWTSGVLFSSLELNDQYLEKLGREPENGKECARALIIACSKFKLMSAVTDPKMKKLLLEANQAGFNVIQTGTRILGTSPKNIVDYVVEFKCNNGARWKNVIDCENEYEFPVELGESSGKSDLDEKSRDSAPVMAAVMKSNARAVRKFGLINSSLGMEATQYDFTAAVTVEESGYYQKIFGGGGDDSKNGTVFMNRSKDNLEWSQVNEHPCMLAYVEAIKNLDAKKSIPENAAIMTRVATEINSRILTKSTIHRNIKIFQIGAILNLKNIFAPHASILCNSIVNLIADQALGADLNYFVKDVLVMLLEWKEIAVPEQEQVKKLLEFYLPKVSYNRKDIMGQNLELLEVIVREWVKGSDDTIPLPVVVEVLRGDAKSGLEICRSLLKGGKFPFKIQDRNKFLGYIGKCCFGGTSKVEWRLAGQVVGLALKNLEEMEDKSNVDEAENFLCKSVLDSLRGKPLVFFTALKNIQEHFPRIVKPYRGIALSSLSNKDAGVEALRTVAAILRIEKKIDESDAGVESLQDFYTELKGRRLFDTPCRTTETLEAAVEILEGFIGEVQDERKVISLIEWASAAASSEDARLRARYASAVSKFYFGSGDMRRSKKELSKKVHQLFIALYYDQDPEVSQIVGQFWSQNLQEWPHTPSLFLQLLEILGADNRNPNQIHIVIDLVIKRCSLSPDFHKSEFQDLGECQFEKYNVDTSWRMRNVTFQPLYAETLSSLENIGHLPKTLQNTLMSQRQATGKLGMNLLKATLAQKQFTPTAPGQYSMDSSSSNETIQVGFNSQMFYGAGQTPSPEEDTSGLGYLRKRFYSRATSDSFSGRQMTKTEASLQRKIESTKVKRSGVKLVREYRIGELPDVKIKNEDFLKIISLMAKVDPELGRAFVVQMFTSILNDPQVNAKSSKLHRDASRTFKEILKCHESDSDLSPQFAAAIIEILVLNSGDVFVPPSLVSPTVRRYELHKLGILLFEKFLEGDQLVHSKDPKRAKLCGDGGGEDTPEANVLLRIAELYKDLEDFDSVPNVFGMAQDKCEDESSRSFYRKGCQALKFECEKKYGDAFEIYRGLYEEELDFEGRDERRLEFWLASFQKCLTHQSDWTRLYEECQNSIQYFEGDNEFDNPDYLHLVLPTQLAAAAQLLVRDTSGLEDEPDDIVAAREFIGKLMENDRIFQVFMADTADIAVIAAVLDHETGSISSYIDKCLGGALKTIQMFHRLSKSKKEASILTLERIALLNDYIVWRRRVAFQDIQAMTEALLLKWERTGRPKTTNLCAADILVAERDLYLTRMKYLIDEADISTDSKSNLMERMDKINVNQYLWLASLSFNESNTNICKKALKKAKEMSRAVRGDEMQVEWHRLSSQYVIQFSHGDRWTKQWASKWKELAKLEGEHRAIVLEAQCTLLQALWLKIWENQEQLVGDEKIRDALGVSKEMELRQHILGVTLEMVHFSTAEAPESMSRDSEMNLQMYRLLKIMREKTGLLTDQAPTADAVNADVDKYMLISLLKAMEGENQEVLFMFPTTFQILESRPSLLSTFSQHVKLVPSWMFLPWLDQIVVNYTHNQVLKNVLEEIVDRLLEDYPQAFQLQYVDLMKRKYQSELPSKFAQALQAVCMPWIYFKEELAKRRTVHEMTLGLNEFLKKAQRVRDNSDEFGSLHQNYIKKVVPMVENFLHRLETEPADGLSREIWKNFGEPIENVSKAICEANRRDDTGNFSLNLKELSPWLASFRSNSYADYIEAPGLYCNFEKPNLHSHPKIVSFYPTVTVMFSLSNPVKLTAMCDNGKLKSYLVKRGDDLRQDKRIQQFFLVANKLFRDDPQCQRRSLRVNAFAVIPMGKCFGLIEWVDNVVSMKGMMLPSKQLKKIYNEMLNAWSEWIQTTFDPRRRRVNLPLAYNVHAQVFGREEAVAKFEELKGRLPSRLMRDHLLQGSSSLEDFFDLRQRMIRSYGSMCIVHWLLGIGDRHLENSLISKATGEVLGIDFGRAFGTPIFMQNIPELIPFRLTPQIQNLLSPYGCSGILKETMLWCLQPLKKSLELLSTVVDVFLHEPAKDWLVAKKRNSSPGDASEDSQSVMATDWDAIKTFKRKLKGDNPVKILSDEIQMMRPESLKPVYTNVLRDGRGALGLPATLPDDQYVEMLISIASDKNILSRLFHGWAPWI